ncbi:MAG: hypothetical protein Q9196_001347 [Gyalolechia fulgens]
MSPSTSRPSEKSATPPSSALDPPPTPFQSSLSKTNTCIHRINQLLSTTSNLDLTLGTLSYTFSFLAAILPFFRIHARGSSGKAPHGYSHAQRLRTLGALLAETRVTLRLVIGVVGVYGSAVEAFGIPTPPSEDKIPRRESTRIAPARDPEMWSAWLSRSSVLAALAFQILENVAFLGDKGVLRLSPDRRARLWLYCSRAWCAGLGVELGRLGLQRWGFRRQDVDGEEKQGKGNIGVDKSEDHSGKDGLVARSEKKQGAEIRTISRRDEKGAGGREEWTRSVKIHTLYMLMAVHYSAEGGVMGEGMLSLCGCLASGFGLREAWRKIR